MTTPARHTETAFENAIEESLLHAGGWSRGDPAAFDRERALHPADFFAFVVATQPQLWADLKKQQGAGCEAAVLDALLKALDARGTLDVLRHGFKFYGKKIECAFFRPAHGLNPDILARYAQNRLVLTRQVRFIPDAADSIDLLLSVNGLPVATAELKNALTQQTVEHAIEQYRQRDGGGGQPGSSRRVPERLPLGGGLAARLLPRHPGALSPRRHGGEAELGTTRPSMRHAPCSPGWTWSVHPRTWSFMRWVVTHEAAPVADVVAEEPAPSPRNRLTPRRPGPDMLDA